MIEEQTDICDGTIIIDVIIIFFRERERAREKMIVPIHEDYKDIILKRLGM